jgi:hypothetical protein
MNNNQNNQNEVTIIRHYSLLSFMQTNGNPEMFDDLVNKETGEQFSLLRFNDAPNGEITVFFGKSVKDYTYDKIMSEFDKLFVGEADNDKVYLYRRHAGKVIKLEELLSVEV